MTQNGSFELIPELNKRAKGYLSSTSVLITLQGRDTIAGKTTTVIYIFYLVFFSLACANGHPECTKLVYSVHQGES